MRRVDTASSWTLYEHDACYYVRYEELVAFLGQSGVADELLRTVIADTLDGSGEPA